MFSIHIMISKRNKNTLHSALDARQFEVLNASVSIEVTASDKIISSSHMARALYVSMALMQREMWPFGDRQLQVMQYLYPL